jgi:hypothetical protein
MANADYVEATILEHREWLRDGKYTLTLKHRSDWTNNAWQIKQFHAYEGGGGFGYNPSFHTESEARAAFGKKVAEEEARHIQWLADETAKGE